MNNENNTDLPLTFTVAEAAKLIAVNPYTIRRLIWRGLIPRITGVRRVRIPRAAFLRFVNADRKGGI